MDLNSQDIGKLQTLEISHFGFIKGSSCLYNLIDLFEKVTKARDEYKTVHAENFDLMKAVDTTPDSGIEERLNKLK